MSSIDVTEDIETGSTGEDVTVSLTQVQEAAQRLAILEDRIAKGTEFLEILKSEKTKLSTDELPDLFMRAKVNSVGLEDGRTISIVPFVEASLPNPRTEKDPILAEEKSERRKKIFEWLEEHGHSDIVKTVVDVQFGKGEYELAEAFLQEVKGLLEQAGMIDDHPPTISQDVHPSTFKALITELYRSQDKDFMAVSDELFKLYTGRVAKVITPGKRGKK